MQCPAQIMSLLRLTPAQRSGQTIDEMGLSRFHLTGLNDVQLKWIKVSVFNEGACRALNLTIG
jgi:hypothetical protein